MVRFSVFNELSLPLSQHQVNEVFGIFFGLLAALKKQGLNQIRMSNDFKAYSILENTSFQQFIGQQFDREFKTRLKSFVNNSVIGIDTPIINDDELEQNNQQVSCEYFYKQQTNNGGLACGDIWDTLVISFKSDEKWNSHALGLTKQTLDEDDSIKNELIFVKHASNTEHLEEHQLFFNAIEVENKLNISQSNFWKNRELNFPKIIKFCPEVETQIKALNKDVFQQFIRILRTVETDNKKITEFNFSGEGRTVKTDPKLRSEREFTIDGVKVFFGNHVKSLPNGYRFYFLQINEIVYIGSIANHFSTAKHK